MESNAIEMLIPSHVKTVGEIPVRRTLPTRARQRVGPFIFFDHMGPVDFSAGTGVNVKPHPHIGLATITYLFSGTIIHRDSLGTVQAINPGEVNWMTAGRGIVHSEKSSQEALASGSHIHGIQAWVALPVEDEEIPPRFEHYDAKQIPVFSQAGLRMRIIAGSAFNLNSPVETCSDTLYAELDMANGANLDMPHLCDEMAIYVVNGEVRIDGQALQSGTMAVLKSGASVAIMAASEAKIMLLGGATLAGHREIWWNFVSSSKNRLEQAKQDWQQGNFTGVPGDAEFIPLPN